MRTTTASRTDRNRSIAIMRSARTCPSRKRPTPLRDGIERWACSGHWSTSTALYVAIFAAFSWPWLREARHAAPLAGQSNPADEWLVIWILSWVSHALATNPLGILDAPINHPARGQLTGSEHFASFQLLFAPVYWLTDNPVLAANLVVFATYPLAALAMERLLRAMGVSGPVAFFGGLLFALGPLRVPAQLHSLQYANLFLPATCLALTRLRSAPTFGHAAVFAIAMGLALFSSYYVAVLACGLVVPWPVFELLAPAPDRTRFAIWATAGALLPLLVLSVASIPYLDRPELASLREAALQPSAARMDMRWTVALVHTLSTGRFALALAALGLGALLIPFASARRCAARGLVLAILALSLMPGPYARWGQLTVPTPFILLAASPAAFFRHPSRFVVLFGFAAALLGTAALEGLWRRFGRRVGWLVVAAVGTAFVATRAPELSGSGLRTFADREQPIYDTLAEIAAGSERGPLLELP